MCVFCFANPDVHKHHPVLFFQQNHTFTDITLFFCFHKTTRSQTSHFFFSTEPHLHKHHSVFQQQIAMFLFLFLFLKRGGCKDCSDSQLIEEKYIAMMEFYMVFTLQSADNSCSLIRVPLGFMNFGDDEFLGGKLFRVTHHIFEFHPCPPMNL